MSRVKSWAKYLQCTVAQHCLHEASQNLLAGDHTLARLEQLYGELPFDAGRVRIGIARTQRETRAEKQCSTVRASASSDPPTATPSATCLPWASSSLIRRASSLLLTDGHEDEDTGAAAASNPSLLDECISTILRNLDERNLNVKEAKKKVLQLRSMLRASSGRESRAKGGDWETGSQGDTWGCSYLFSLFTVFSSQTQTQPSPDRPENL